MVVLPFALRHRVSAGMFWCHQADLDAIGGFDEPLVCVGDVDFAKRLKKLGRSRSQRDGTIRKDHLTTSCRKFDQFGDWIFVRRPGIVLDIFNQKKKTADAFYDDARSERLDDSR